MKKSILYTFIVMCLSTLTAIGVGFGSHFIELFCMSAIFWACMLLPFLNKH